MHKIGNIDIIGNFYSHICSFLPYMNHIIVANVKFDASLYKRIIFLRLQTSLVLFISCGTVKPKLAILAFLYCEEFVKTSIER